MGIKKFLKNHFQCAYRIYRKQREQNIIRSSISNPTKTTIKLYEESFGRKLDLDNPMALTEKIQWLKLEKYWRNPIVTRCADKYAVREYIIEKGCDEILTKLYGAWDSVDDIDWDSLPNKFVLKCNHGSGFNIVCKDKTKFNIPEATEKLKEWMNTEYGQLYVEQGIYQDIKRKIIAEQFIETKDNLPPHDYKFFASYGKVQLLFVASDRYGNNTKFDYYYPDWTWIDVRNYFENHGPDVKPSCLEKMEQYASVLSKDFPLVRVDLYNEGEKIFFGELTFTHFGGLNGFDPDTFDFKFGSMFPEKSELEKWPEILKK